MLITVREACPFSFSPICFTLSSPSSTFNLSTKPSYRLKTSFCRETFSVQSKLTTTKPWNAGLNSNSCEGSVFDPLGINTDVYSGLNSAWESMLALLSPTFESASSTKKDKPSARGVVAAIEDSSIDFGDFFKGPLPGKFLKLLGFLALSRLGIYIPLGGVNRDAFAGNLDQNSLLSTLDSFSGGGIGRLGICSLGIVPFINAQIVFQLLAQVYPKLQDLQKREGEAGRKKVLQYTRYASVGFAIVQAIGQVLYLRPYVNDFSTQWVLSSVTLLTLGSVFTTYLGERISDLKLGNGTSLLIFTSIISYLPASFGRTFAQAFQDGNYVGLVTIIISFFLLVLGIVYVQEAERKIPLNYASRYTSRTGGLQKSAYLPFKLNIKNAFPHGDLQEEVYMEQPPGFVAQGEYGKVCHLRKSLYGLKQSPRAWFGKFSQAVEKFGMMKSKSDHSVFYKQSEVGIILLVVYVDDNVITGSDTTGISSLKSFLHTQFYTKDLGMLLGC